MRNLSESKILPRSMKRLGPCDGCPHAERCAKERLACLDYRRYVRGGRATGRTPTREIYRAVMG